MSNQLQATNSSKSSAGPGGHALRTFAIAVGIFLLYAFAVQATRISLEKPLDPGRQESLIRVLRLLADPDLVTRDEVTGALVLSESSVITIERIVETVLMALMASTIGTVIAVPISFIAARNLMDQVTAPAAAIATAVVAMPVGGWLAWAAAGWVFRLPASFLGESSWLALAAALAAAAAIWAVVALGTPLFSDHKRPRRENLIAIGKVLLALALAIFAVGALVDLGAAAGGWLEDRLGAFGFMGNFLAIISDFLRISLPALFGLLGALLAASLGARYGQEAVLSLAVGPARIISAAASALGAAVLTYGIGTALNWLYQFDNPENWTTLPALAAAGVGALVGMIVKPKHPFAIGLTIYTISRSILNMLRSIEPLIMGIVFVVWVSLGPFAGVMALTLHSIAALGKLFSEQVESISEGPVEALTATGANRLQTIVFAVVPQIVPPYIAFTLYRWDINVRMSTIIGFVGGGGIGFVLSQNIQQLRYRQASVMMLAIAIVVSLLDYISSSVRKRII